MRVFFTQKLPLILVFISLLPLFGLFLPGLPITHDGQDHVARIANFYQSLSEGNIVPRWANNLNWGYGHPILMFLYPLPSYSASAFHFLGISLVDSVKLVFGLAYIASIFAMYFWLKDVFGNIPAFVGAVVYGFAPYRFVDLYVRGAIGEHTAFVFLPIVFWGVWLLAKKQKRGLLFTSVSIACLGLSHNAVLIMVLPIVVLYFVYLFAFERKSLDFIFDYCISVMIGFGLSGFFLLPAYFEGKYTLRDIVTNNEVFSRFTSWTSFFYSPWNFGGTNELSKSLGFAVFAVLIIFIFLRNSLVEKKHKFFLFGIVGLLLISMYLMTENSSIVWKYIVILQKFQFPWRFLVVTTFLSAILASLCVAISRGKEVAISILLVIIAISTTIHMWSPKATKIYEEEFFAGIYNGTTDTGESSPIWSVRFMEKKPKAHLEVIEGNALIDEIFRSTTRREYFVNVFENTRFVENTLYFPGWKVLVDNQTHDIQFQDPEFRGLQTFWLEPGEHNIEIEFGTTRVRKISEIFTIVSFVVLGLYYFRKQV